MFGIKNLFKREEKASLTNLQTPPQIKEQDNSIHIPKNQEQPKEVQENKKTEIEILIAKIDALKFQYEALSEKISNMEKMLKEIYEIAKSSS
jgi:vacuolar-type H+-ATPase subunit I/STV1